MRGCRIHSKFGDENIGILIAKNEKLIPPIVKLQISANILIFYEKTDI